MSEDTKARIAKLRQAVETRKASSPSSEDDLAAAIEPIITRLERLIEVSEKQSQQQQQQFREWASSIGQATELLAKTTNQSKAVLESSVQNGMNNFQQEIKQTSEQAQKVLGMFRFDISMLLIATSVLVGLCVGVYQSRLAIAPLNDQVRELSEKIDTLSAAVEASKPQPETKEKPKEKKQRSTDR